MWYVHPYQSCQPLHFGHSFLHPRALHYAATIMIVSLRSPSEILFILDPLHACGHQMRQQPVACAFFVSEMLVVPQPISIRVLTSWPVVAFSSPLLCVTSWQDNFRFQSFQMAVPKQAPGWWVLSKKLHTKVSWKIVIQKSLCALYIQRRAPNMWRAVPASSVLGTFLSPMAECTMSNNTSTRNVTSTKDELFQTLHNANGTFVRY